VCLRASAIPRSLLGLALSLVTTSPVLSGQDPKAPALGLNITIVGDEGPINQLKLRTARIIVQVQDENRKPVAGAAVAFQLTAGRGATGWLFSGKALKGATDLNGLIKTVPLKLDHLARVRVTASFQGFQSAAAEVSHAQLLTATAPGVTGATAGTGAATTGASAGAAASTASVATATGAAAAAGAGIGVSAGAAVVAGGVGAAAAAGIASRAAGSGNDDRSTPPPSATIGLPGIAVIGPASVSYGWRALFAQPVSTAPARGGSAFNTGLVRQISNRNPVLSRMPAAELLARAVTIHRANRAGFGLADRLLTKIFRGRLSSIRFTAQPGLVAAGITGSPVAHRSGIPATGVSPAYFGSLAALRVVRTGASRVPGPPAIGRGVPALRDLPGPETRPSRGR
jgi:hypothetical protein